MAFFTGTLLLDILGIFTALVAVVYAYFKWTYQYWKRKNIPYIEPSIPFGSVPGPFKRTTTIGEDYHNLYKEAKAKGWKYFGLYTLTIPLLMVTDLDLIKNVLTKDFGHFLDRGLYTNDKDDPISSHLANVSGARWKNLRVKLTPVFSSGKLKSMFQTLVDCGLVLEKYFAESVENRTAVDIKDVLGRFTTDVIGSCAFGLECNSFKEPNSPFRIYGKKIFERSKLDVLRDMFTSSYPNLARALRIRGTPKDVSDFFTKVVEDTVSYRQKTNLVRKDILQMLMDLKSKDTPESGHQADGKTLTMPEIVAQSFMFFTGGFETSSTTMTFALFELATHPEIQEKLRREINTVLAKHDNQVTYDTVNEIKYLAQVIDETLRVHAPAPFTIRVCSKDYKVPGEDIVIEKGVRVVIPILPLQYDEEYFKNPKVFNPDNFNQENKSRRHPYTHIPFGEGPRNCIGERFGVMQSKVGLACILRKFRVTLNGKTTLPLKMSPTSLLASAEDGIWLDLEQL